MDLSRNSNNWIATVLINSDHEKDPEKNPDRKQEMARIIRVIIQKCSGDGVILFPAGWIHTAEKSPRSYYNELKDEIITILERHPAHVIICIGIDGSWHKDPDETSYWDRDQIALAIDHIGIQAIARKFHRTVEERLKTKAGISRVEPAQFYDSRGKEDGMDRIFELNNIKYYLAVCYDGYAHQENSKYWKNPGIDVVLNLIHRFPNKGEGSGIGRQVFCGFKGISEMWDCPVFGSAIFINRPIKDWPSAAYWPFKNNEKIQACYNNVVISSDENIPPENEIESCPVKTNELEVKIRIFYNYIEKIEKLKTRSQTIDNYPVITNNQKKERRDAPSSCNREILTTIMNLFIKSQRELQYSKFALIMNRECQKRYAFREWQKIDNKPNKSVFYEINDWIKYNRQEIRIEVEFWDEQFGEIGNMIQKQGDEISKKMPGETQPIWNTMTSPGWSRLQYAFPYTIDPDIITQSWIILIQETKDIINEWLKKKKFSHY